jgi:hypothetical protein
LNRLDGKMYQLHGILSSTAIEPVLLRIPSNWYIMPSIRFILACNEMSCRACSWSNVIALVPFWDVFLDVESGSARLLAPESIAENDRADHEVALFSRQPCPP